MYPDLAVVCLCAEWCGSCREYRAEFERLAGQFPGVAFLWRDIEDDAGSLGDIEVENFPTILVRRREWVLFFGAMLPQAGHLRRLIETFLTQTIEESRRHALSTPERSAWQTDPDLRDLGRNVEDGEDS
jgi:thiol-disulfide isomerase/thioredoxin